MRFDFDAFILRIIQMDPTDIDSHAGPKKTYNSIEQFQTSTIISGSRDVVDHDPTGSKTPPKKEKGGHFAQTLNFS